MKAVRSDHDTHTRCHTCQTQSHSLTSKITHKYKTALRLWPRWIRPHWAGRKLHLCRQTRSLRLSPWVLLMSQPTCSSDPTRLALAQNRQSVPLPAFQLCVPALRPHAAHGGSHRENISSLFWLLEESQLQHSLLWQPGIFVTHRGGV